jgi:DNA-binding NtrC family response regulator
MGKRLLVAWIGYHDLRVMAEDQPPTVRRQILDKVRHVAGPGEHGPLKTLVDQEPFDRLVLFSNLSPDWSRRYVKWLGLPAELVMLDIPNPTDYERIFRSVDAHLARLRDARLLKTHELCIHLSPGTPAMAAVWLLLGKSKYPATFYQSFQGRAWITDIPFDLAVDFLPDLYAEPDKHLQHLAARSPHEVAGFETIVGESPSIRTAVGRACRAAVRGVPVLLLGESGVGKEMFARAIHEASARRGKPFVAINCAAVARELLESEFFGHKRGAFTGATREHAGAFSQADGGTLLLDEIGECDLELQAKLLRVLQAAPGAHSCQREFRPVGATRDQTSNVRVIAATNHDLVQAVAEGRFREDLYYRLAVITVTLPPLRERRSDIPRIAAAMLHRINQEFAAEGEPGYQAKTLGDSAVSFARRYAWPGNVRQLYNVLVQAAVMTDAPVLERRDLAAAIAHTPDVSVGRSDPLQQALGDGFDLEQHLDGIRRHYLQRAMDEAGGVKAEAARLLGLASYQTLDGQLKRLGVNGRAGSRRY